MLNKALDMYKKIKTRVASFITRDTFSFMFKDRREHLNFSKTLITIYKKPQHMSILGNYELPTKVLESFNESSLIITGGVEFHIEFEEMLDDLTSAQFHFFEVDSRSISWFKEKYKEKKNFKIFEKGLGATIGSLPVYGNVSMGWSSSVDPKIYNGSMLDWQEIGETEITTIEQYCKNSNINKIDLLKLDIEGMAREVLIAAWDSNIFPLNILLEIERGESEKFSDYKKDIDTFIDRAIQHDYEIIFLERKDAFNSFTLEFFLSKKS
tara:strand:- start:11386 stop:12186 length:801 start_codon:yes stop_codon:yes gene_type:complete